MTADQYLLRLTFIAMLMLHKATAGIIGQGNARLAEVPGNGQNDQERQNRQHGNSPAEPLPFRIQLS